MAFREKDDGILLYGGASLDQVIDEVKGIGGVHKEIDMLITKVRRMNAIMKDAEKKQPFTSSEDRFLFQGTKQVLLDAEDLLDELATDVALRKMSGQTQESAWFEVTTQRKDRILEIKDRLVDEAQSIDTSGLQRSTGGDDIRLELFTRRQTGSLLPYETRIIGRDMKKEEIKQLLFLPSTTPIVDSSRENGAVFSILPIVGMGGIGKTALAQLVYNDQDVKKHFGLMMWVCVSNNPDPVRLTKNMIESVLDYKGKQQTYKVKNWDTMQRALEREIEGNTFLLVLDDVWEAERSIWEKLLVPLYSGNRGSRVLVTARSRVFVDKMKAQVDPAILLQGLSDDDTWDILRRYALGGDAKDSGTAAYLEGMKRCVDSRLKGSPLAAKTVGSLLSSLDMKHWKTVLESPLWKLKQEEDGILPALQLSFQYLSPDLKHSFAYCSLFPKDHKFFMEEMDELWEAQSFSKKREGGRMEIMGHENFVRLVCLSFFDTTTNTLGGRDVVMHDLIHDLAELVSVGDCFRLEEEKRGVIPNTTRHMSVIWSPKLDKQMLVDNLCGLEKLRSLLFVGWWRNSEDVYDLHKIFEHLKMLRVLCLSDCMITELPPSIGDLKHLRYLDLGHNKLKCLPETLGNLYNLQVLNLEACYSLRRLPTTMSQLVNLRHLRGNESLVMSIERVGKLTKLQNVDVWGRNVKELGGMRLLRHLTIDKLEEVESKEEAYQARLDAMEHLLYLNLRWDKCDSDHLWLSGEERNSKLDEEVLQALRPNEGIEELHIDGYGGVKSPDWLQNLAPTSFACLRRVYLSGGKAWKDLPFSSLSQLCRLEHAEIAQMPEWEQWSCQLYPDSSRQGCSSVPHSLFPCLRQLKISDCPKLKDLFLLPPTLESLYLKNIGISHLRGFWNSPVTWQPYPDSQQGSSFVPHSFFSCLRELKIEHCPKLKDLDLLIPPTLESLYLYDVGVYCLPGIWGGDGTRGDTDMASSSLSKLEIDHCDELASICGMLQNHLPKLVDIKISNCPKLANLPERGFGHLVSLRSLCLIRCPKLNCAEVTLKRKRQDATTQHLPCSLRLLSIEDCGDSMGRWWWEGVHSLTSITEMHLSGCSTTAKSLFAGSGRRHQHHYRHTGLQLNHAAPSTFPQHLTSLKELTLADLEENLGSLKLDLSVLTSLQTLIIRCPSIQSLDAVALPRSLKEFTLFWCENLLSVPYTLDLLYCLETLDIEKCPSIKTLEAVNLPCSLKNLSLNNCTNLHSLPNRLCHAASLVKLQIRHCPSIKTLETVMLPRSLKEFCLRFCENLSLLPNSLSLLPSLDTLDIFVCPSIKGPPANGFQTQ